MVSVYFVGPTYPLVTVQPRRSADQPLSSSFLFLLRVSFPLPPTLPSSLSFFHLLPLGFYCSPYFFQGHFSSIFLSSFEEEEFPSFFSPSLSLSPSLFQHGVFCADTLDESKGFLDRFTRLFFFEENCSFVYIYVCVCVSSENSIGRASFYPEEKLKRSRRYTYSSWHAHLSNGHVHQPLSKC